MGLMLFNATQSSSVELCRILSKFHQIVRKILFIGDQSRTVTKFAVLLSMKTYQPCTGMHLISACLLFSFFFTEDILLDNPNQE